MISQKNDSKSSSLERLVVNIKTHHTKGHLIIPHNKIRFVQNKELDQKSSATHLEGGETYRALQSEVSTENRLISTLTERRVSSMKKHEPLSPAIESLQNTILQRQTSVKKEEEKQQHEDIYERQQKPYIPKSAQHSKNKKGSKLKQSLSEPNLSESQQQSSENDQLQRNQSSSIENSYTQKFPSTLYEERGRQMIASRNYGENQSMRSDSQSIDNGVIRIRTKRLIPNLKLQQIRSQPDLIKHHVPLQNSNEFQQINKIANQQNALNQVEENVQSNLNQNNDTQVSKLEHLSHIIGDLLDNQKKLKDKIEENQEKLEQLAIEREDSDSILKLQYQTRSSSSKESPLKSKVAQDEFLIRQNKSSLKQRRYTVDENEDQSNQQFRITKKDFNPYPNSHSASAQKEGQNSLNMNVNNGNLTEKYLERAQLTNRNAYHLNQIKKNINGLSSRKSSIANSNMIHVQNQQEKIAEPYYDNILQIPIPTQNPLQDSSLLPMRNIMSRGDAPLTRFGNISISKRIKKDFIIGSRPPSKSLNQNNEQVQNQVKAALPTPIKKNSSSSSRQNFDFKSQESHSRDDEDEIRRSLERIQNSVKQKPQLQISQIKEELKFQELLSSRSGKKNSSQDTRKNSALKSFENLIPIDTEKSNQLPSGKKGMLDSLNRISEIYLNLDSDPNQLQPSQQLQGFQTLKNQLFESHGQDDIEYEHNNHVIPSSNRNNSYKYEQMSNTVQNNDAQFRLTFMNRGDDSILVQGPIRSESPRISTQSYSNSQIRIRTRISRGEGGGRPQQSNRVKSLMRSKNHFPKDFF